MERIKNGIIPESWKQDNYKYESQFQADVILMINQEFPRLRDLTWHTKNENYIQKKEGEGQKEYEQRCLREGGKDKAQGKKAGGHDVFIRYKGIIYGMELKIKNRGLKDSQKIFHENWRKDFDFNTSTVVNNLYDAYKYCKWIMNNNYCIITK